MNEQIQGWQLPRPRGVWHFWWAGAFMSMCNYWWADYEARTYPMPEGRACKRCAKHAGLGQINAPLP